MPVYAFAAFLMIGAFGGWLGGMLLKTRGLGLIGNVIVGAIGACIGGVLVSVTGLSAAGTMGSLLAAAIGAAVVLAALRLTNRARAGRNNAADGGDSTQ